MTTSRTSKVFLALLAVYCAGCLVYLSLNAERPQWDFKTYYYAAKVYTSGGNPYDLEALTRTSGEKITLPYVYPRFTLVFFLPFTFCSYAVAYQVYLLLKVAALVALFRLWIGSFLKEDGDLLFYPFSLLAFNNAIGLDLFAGNITTFEQLALWAAFFCYIRQRLLPFSLLVLVASFFKLTPILFLTLLPFSKDKKRYIYLGLAAFAFATILVSGAGQEVGRSGFLYQSLSVSSDPDNRGLWNPSVFSLIRDVLYEFSAKWGFRLHRVYPLALWLVAASVILGARAGLLRAEEALLGEGVSDSVAPHPASVYQRHVPPGYQDPFLPHVGLQPADRNFICLGDLPLVSWEG